MCVMSVTSVEVLLPKAFRGRQESHCSSAANIFQAFIVCEMT